MARSQKRFLHCSRVVVVGVLLLTGRTVGGADTAPNVVTLNLEPTAEHPRNSDGAFATLASGRILFCYTQYYVGAADESPARIVHIDSDDQGRTWSQPVVMVANKVARMS
jgi:sialidase-1